MKCRPTNDRVNRYLAALSAGLAGRLEEVPQYAMRALEMNRSQEALGAQAHALRRLGDIVMHRHPPAINQAETYQQVFSLADELGMHQ